MADIEERTLSPTDPTQFERGRKIAEALVLEHHGVDLGLQSEEDVNYFIEKAVDLNMLDTWEAFLADVHDCFGDILPKLDRRKGSKIRRQGESSKSNSHFRREGPTDRRTKP